MVSILEDPKLIEIIQNEFDTMGIVNEEKNRLIVFYTFLGAKLLPEPPNIIFQGASSSGKSFLTQSTSINFPKGYDTTILTDDKGKKQLITDWKSGFGYIPFNDMTTAALYRIGLENPSFFDQKVIVQRELPQQPSDEQKRVQQIIRILLSEGEVTKSLTIEGKPIVINLKGHPAFISCDATFEIDDQLMNRTLLLNPDESMNQTKAILKRQGEFAEKPWLDRTIMTASEILSRIHEELEPFPIYNRWGKKVSQLLFKISGDPQLRRTNKLVLRFIELRTLLFQEQRMLVYREEEPEINYLETTREDVIETIRLLSQTITQTITRVMDTALGFLQDIIDKSNHMFWEIIEENEIEREIPNEFTYQGFAEFKRTTRKSVYRHLKSLVDSNLLICDSSSRQHKLKLNVERKSPPIVSDCLGDNLEAWFPEKPISEGLVQLSMRNFQEARYRLQTSGSPMDIAHRQYIGDDRDMVPDEQEEENVSETIGDN